MSDQPSKAQKIAGIVLTALPGLMLLMSAGMKLSGSPEVVEGFGKFGFAPEQISSIAIIEAIVALLYLVPKTSFLGAILATGYMGGAVCTHVRVGEPWFAPFLFGVIIWVGFGLRRPAVIKSAFGL